MIILLVIVFGGVFGFDALKVHMMTTFFASYQPPPATISATKAKAVVWQPYLKSVGHLKAVNGVNISTDTAGIVEDRESAVWGDSVFVGFFFVYVLCTCDCSFQIVRSTYWRGGVNA